MTAKALTPARDEEISAMLLRYAGMVRMFAKDLPDGSSKELLTAHILEAEQFASDVFVNGPARYRLVCACVSSVTNEDIAQRSASTLARLRKMSTAALNGESLTEFIQND